MSSSSHLTDTPQSVEEAGALLGAAITRCGMGQTSYSVIAPPKGMHSSFGTASPVPSSEIFIRLLSLRTLLRKASSQKESLAAAPSILAVLLKLLSASSSIGSSLSSNAGQLPPPPGSSTSSSSSAGSSNAAASSSSMSNPIYGRRGSTPPMLSTALRKLWVDCVVLCHILGDGLPGKSRIDVLPFTRSMIVLAGMNPKSAKAAGGTRLAALDVVSSFFLNEPLSSKLAPWALEVITLCQKGIKSSGYGEPSHRIACIRTACSAITACKEAYKKQRSINNKEVSEFIMPGAIEQVSVIEIVKLLRQAVSDKFPEVRNAAATLATLAAPILVHDVTNSNPKMSSGSKNDAAVSPTSSLDDVLYISLRNCDDESACVSAGWSEALARCICTSIEYSKQGKGNHMERGSSGRKSDSGGSSIDGKSSDSVNRFASRKAVGMSSSCSSLKASIQFLTKHFVKVGGELAASRGGGPFSAGGRSVRIGVSLAILNLINLQYSLGRIGEGEELPLNETIYLILDMVGPRLFKQLHMSAEYSEDLDATSVQYVSPEKSSSFIFSSNRNKYHGDGGLARLATSRVLRQGLSELAPEPLQLGILRELISLCSLACKQEAEGQETQPSAGSSDSKKDSYKDGGSMNPNQVMVALTELSHLISTLGEGIASTIDDLIPMLKGCLAHPSHGVRHEAAITCAVLAMASPMEGKKLFDSSVESIQIHHAEIVTLASMGNSENAGKTPTKTNRFRKPQIKVDTSLPHQYAIHGNAMMMSLIIRELPQSYGGLPTQLLGTALSCAEILISCQSNESMAQYLTSATCTCVRAGYSIISGAFTTGAFAITPHIALIFGLWQKSGKLAKTGQKHFSANHDLTCVDAALSSVVAFLTHCSELIMAVPDALSRTTIILEEFLPLFLPDGRLGSTPLSPSAVSRFESAKASLMEASAWLPPGSYPMIADSLFSFAASHIESATKDEVTCSILLNLVNKEDSILDAKSQSRAKHVEQLCGVSPIAENLILLDSNVAHHAERESVLNLLPKSGIGSINRDFNGSSILGLYADDGPEPQPPTALHEVGTWRQPIPPSCCSKVRLVDAAVQAFSATFGLKDGKEQQKAMNMLEALIPPILAQLARSIGATTSIALREPDRRSKMKEESAAVANITAVVLACLKALPRYESTHNVPISLGPVWMNKAKDLLLTVLPSTSSIVRRAAAEGLALLATLGVSEDAHMLQSSVLHSLDEVMQGNEPDGKPRVIPLESLSAARAGSLLTLACIQRTSTTIRLEQQTRLSEKLKDQDQGVDADLPTMQMMTRVLPSLACNSLLADPNIVKAYALHSFGLLIAHGTRLKATKLSVEDEHLLHKLVEVVEDNFMAAWTAASADFDKGQEVEKLAADSALQSVLLRWMTFLLPELHHLQRTDSGIASRFSGMASLILESPELHPLVVREGISFIEQLSTYKHLLSHSNSNFESAVSLVVDSNVAECPSLLAKLGWICSRGRSLLLPGKRAELVCTKITCCSQVLDTSKLDNDIPFVLFSLLAGISGNKISGCSTFYPDVAVSIDTDLVSCKNISLEADIINALDCNLFRENETSMAAGQARLVYWLLLGIYLSGGGKKTTNLGALDGVTKNAITRAKKDADSLFMHGASRWQLKCNAAKSISLALDEITEIFEATNSHEESDKPNQKVPPVALALLEEIITAACSLSAATLDQSELIILQEGGTSLLTSLIARFGVVDDPGGSGASILTQYASQIYSSIRIALSSLADYPGDDSYGLFLSGCEALQIAAEQQLITDPMVMRRLVRPVIPELADIPIYSYKSGPQLKSKAKEELRGHNEVVLAPKICKLWTISRLRVAVELNLMSKQICDSFLEESRAFEKEVAVHSVPLAIDGARILIGNGLTLCGFPSQRRDASSYEYGFTYSNFDNLDDLSKSIMVQAWATCACNAVICLGHAITTKDGDETNLQCFEEWLGKVIPTIYAGIHDALTIMEGPAVGQCQVSWARGLDADAVALVCVHGLRALFKDSLVNQMGPVGTKDIGNVVCRILNVIILPCIKSKSLKGARTVSKVQPNNLHRNSELVQEACQLLVDLSSCGIPMNENSELLPAILEALQAIQPDLESTMNAMQILDSLLQTAHHLVSKHAAPEFFVKSTLDYSITLLSSSVTLTNEVRETASSLFRQCITHDIITDSQRRLIARSAAARDEWDVWAMVCLELDDGSCVRHSLESVKKAISDVGNPENNLAAICAVRRVMQGFPATSPVVGYVVRNLGSQILVLFKAYSTLSNKISQELRMTACIESMKVIMVAFQQLTSLSSSSPLYEQKLTTFVTLLLEIFVQVTQFNGLPNYPASMTSNGAEPKIGQMSAQAAVHIARTVPTFFKASLSHLSDQSRAVIEMSIRAEMSGYRAAETQPQKKKLSLKGFR